MKSLENNVNEWICVSVFIKSKHVHIIQFFVCIVSLSKLNAFNDDDEKKKRILTGLNKCNVRLWFE